MLRLCRNTWTSRCSWLDHHVTEVLHLSVHPGGDTNVLESAQKKRALQVIVIIGYNLHYMICFMPDILYPSPTCINQQSNFWRPLRGQYWNFAHFSLLEGTDRQCMYLSRDLDIPFQYTTPTSASYRLGFCNTSATPRTDLYLCVCVDYRRGKVKVGLVYLQLCSTAGVEIVLWGRRNTQLWPIDKFLWLSVYMCCYIT